MLILYVMNNALLKIFLIIFVLLNINLVNFLSFINNLLMMVVGYLLNNY